MERRILFKFILVSILVLPLSSIFIDVKMVWSYAVKDIGVGDRPHALEYDPSNGNMYVANYYSNSVSVIDSATNTVVDTVGVGDNPIAIEYNPSNNYLYVAEYYSATRDLGSVSVIDSS